MMNKLIRKFKRSILDRDPGFCDMYESEGSRTAAQEYLTHIRPPLQQQFGAQRLTVLDAGCQAGRFLIPLAEEGHDLIGIDTSGFALRRARRHAKAKGLSVRLHRDTIAHLRR
ncbi:MAG: class I SAM-dependent methyltransferase, partial [Candidatus Omnitrophica bacterium]|nr:class I SAM-dependent methyltransferase [Candidatus Omnitrophota bacterium]